MELIEFTDGHSVINFVGKKSIFSSKEDFFKAMVNEFDCTLGQLFTESELAKIPELDVEDLVLDGAYCRYYTRIPEEASHLGLESGYLFCPRGQGAFEVYVVNVDELKDCLKSPEVAGV